MMMIAIARNVLPKPSALSPSLQEEDGVWFLHVCGLKISSVKEKRQEEGNKLTRREGKNEDVLDKRILSEGVGKHWIIAFWQQKTEEERETRCKVRECSGSKSQIFRLDVDEEEELKARGKG